MTAAIDVRKVGRRAGSGEAGFSLVEFLVAVLIFTIATAAIYQLLRVGTSDRFTINQRWDILQSARGAIATIGLDCINAGYEFPDGGSRVGNNSLLIGAGLPNTDGSDADQLQAIFPRNDVTTDAQLLSGTDQITIASVDDTFNLDANNFSRALPISSIAGSGQHIAVVASGTSPSGVVRVGEIYIFTADGRSRIGWCTGVSGQNVTFGTGDPLGMNVRNTTSGAGFLFVGDPDASPAYSWSPTINGALRRLRLVTYLVTPDNTLVRRTYGRGSVLAGAGSGVAANAPWVDMPLAEGVTDFQIQYVVQDPNNASQTSVVNAPAVNQLPFIRQVRVTIGVTGSQIDRATGEPFRTTTTASFNTRNILYNQ